MERNLKYEELDLSEGIHNVEKNFLDEKIYLSGLRSKITARINSKLRRTSSKGIDENWEQEICEALKGKSEIEIEKYNKNQLNKILEIIKDRFNELARAEQDLAEMKK